MGLGRDSGICDEGEEWQQQRGPHAPGGTSRSASGSEQVLVLLSWFSSSKSWQARTASPALIEELYTGLHEAHLKSPPSPNLPLAYRTISHPSEIT